MNPISLDISSLPWLPLEARSAFPRQSCIYFAIDAQDQIQYIGRSSDAKQRWGNHHRYEQLEAIGSVRVAYLFMDADLLPSVESALIEWFQPPLNKVLCSGRTREGQTGSQEKAEIKIALPDDLKRRFKSACANQDRTMAEVVQQLIEEWLREQPQK